MKISTDVCELWQTRHLYKILWDISKIYFILFQTYLFGFTCIKYKNISTLGNRLF